MNYYLKLLAKKKRTVSFVKENGEVIPATELIIYPPFITDIGEKDSNGSIDIRLASKFLLNKRKITKATYCFFEKRHLLPLERILSGKINSELLKSFIEKKIFDERYTLLRLVFVANLSFNSVDVTSRTKGLGFTGTIKRHGFKQGPKTHGSKSYRRPGSIGAGTTPGRVLKNKRMAGQEGFKTKTIKNINILQHKGLILLVSNSIPGKNNSDVVLTVKF